MGSKSTNNNRGKTFYFYYDMSYQKLTVYPGTSSDEIKSTIRELLNIPNESKLEYLDENGDPIVISSALPNEIKIYVKIKKTFTDKFIEQQSKNENKKIENSIEWFWNESERPKYHIRKNNNKTISQPVNECFSITKGTLIIESGEYYYTLLFEPLQCCVFAGIYPVNIEYKNEEKNELFGNFWSIWPDYDDPHNTFPGPIIEAGFYVNMNLKLLVIYDNKKKKEIKRVNFSSSWNKVSPYVEFKHVVSVTISSNAIQGRPNFIKI